MSQSQPPDDTAGRLELARARVAGLAASPLKLLRELEVGIELAQELGLERLVGLVPREGLGTTQAERLELARARAVARATGAREELRAAEIAGVPSPPPPAPLRALVYTTRDERRELAGTRLAALLASVPRPPPPAPPPPPPVYDYAHDRARRRELAIARLERLLRLRAVPVPGPRRRDSTPDEREERQARLLGKFQQIQQREAAKQRQRLEARAQQAELRRRQRERAG